MAADPTSALAHLGLGAVALYRHEWERCREEAHRATEISPGHPSHLFTAGGLLASVGDWSEGVELMRRSFALTPLHPPYQHGNLALERLMAGDLAGALAEASIVDDGGGVWGPFCRALALEGLGHHDQARTEMTKALQYAPALIEDPDTLFGATVLDDTQRATLLSLLEPFR